MLRAGQILGSYRIIEQLSRGAMGIVFVAEHALIGRRVALKVIAPEMAENPDAVKLFFREARAANQIEHPNIIQITDLVEAHGEQPCFMVMELLDGHSLGEVIEEERRLPQQRVAEVGAQIADAMDAAHGVGVIHRDLKPDNVFLCHRGGEVKILDFGLAHLGARRRGASERAAVSCGTPLYMSPEQAGADRIDERADIYSLGALLYEALCGSPVFEHESVRDLMLAHIADPPTRLSEREGIEGPIDRELEALVMQCLEKSPEKRPSSMAALSERLRAVARRLAEEARAVAEPMVVEMRRRSRSEHSRTDRDLDALIEGLRGEAAEAAEADFDEPYEVIELIPVEPDRPGLPASSPERGETLMVRPLPGPRRSAGRKVLAAVLLVASLALVPFHSEILGFATEAAARFEVGLEPVISTPSAEAAQIPAMANR